MRVDDHFEHTSGAKTAQSDLQHGAARNFDQGFGAIVGQRPQARAHSGGQDHGFHLAVVLQLDMPHHHLHPVRGSQMPGQLFSQENRPVLASRTTERDHQVFKVAALIALDACVHQRHDVREELVDAVLLVEILDHGRVLAGQVPEAFLAPGIGKAARVEYESAAVS